METINAVVLAVRASGEKGHFLDILTENNTVLEVYVRGGNKLASSMVALAQPFVYFKGSLTQRGGRHYLDSAEIIHIFYHLREKLSMLGLATYFGQLVTHAVPAFTPKNDNCAVMRLFLNTLHYLEAGEITETMIKAIFELRLLTELGHMPDATICRQCGAYTPPVLDFSVAGGYFCCSTCPDIDKTRGTVRMTSAGLLAIRHIIFAPFERLFRFRLGEKNLNAVGTFTERFVLYHLDGQIKALDFYKEISQIK